MTRGEERPLPLSNFRHAFSSSSTKRVTLVTRLFSSHRGGRCFVAAEEEKLTETSRNLFALLAHEKQLLTLKKKETETLP